MALVGWMHRSERGARAWPGLFTSLLPPTPGRGAGGWPEGLQAWALMFLSLTVPTVDRPCLKKDADRADWIYVPNDPVPSSKNSNTGSFSVHANLLFAKGSVLQTWPSAFMRKPCCCKS